MGITNAKITNLTIETARIEPLLPIQEEIKGRSFKKGGKQLLYIFNKQEQLLTILDNTADTAPIISAIPVEQLNKEHNFTFSISADHEDAVHVEEGNLVAFEDIEGDFHLFEINLVEDSHTDEAVRNVTCEHASYEMLDDYVEDYRPETTALDALTKALLSTRWQVGIVADLGINSTNFYRENPKSCINKIINTWGGELRYRVTVEGNEITGRYVDILARRGADTGKRFEYGKDLVEVKRTVDITKLKTALRGWGKGEETEDGFGRRIDFKDVEWSIANGDPVDKPLGQDWVGDPDALKDNGRVIKSKTALSFDGVDDYVVIPDSTSLKPSNFTVEFLVNPVDWNATAANALVTKRIDITEGLFIFVLTSTKILHIDIQGSINRWNTGYAPPAGENTHLVISYDGTTIKLYENAILINSKSLVGASISSTSSLFFGRDSLSGRYFLNGILDDVRIWNVARTQAEIQANMNIELIGSETGLVGYWKLNEGTGTTALDSTANANNGTINGATWVEDLKYVHRFGIFEDSEIEDPAELLLATYNQLQQIKTPILNYAMKVIVLERITGYEHEKVRLGDTTAIIDDEIKPVIELKSRVIELRRDLLEPEKDGVIVGQFLPLFTDEDPALQKVIAKVNDNAGIWDTVSDPITDSSFPDIIPSVPTNVKADGLFQNVMVSWDYDGASYIKAYEVYASEIVGFTTSSINLVFRGNTSSYSFDGEVNKQYYFRVRAINYHGGASAYSAEVSATTARIITDDILFGAVTADLLADISVEASKLANSAVTAEKIANLAVGTAAIANLAVTNGKIGLLAVGTAQIADATITNAKIGNLAVDEAKIANLAVTGAKIADATITNAKIANLAVTDAKIANATITSAKIVSLNADKIVATSLSAISANLGTVTAGTLSTNTVINVGTDITVGDNIYLGNQFFGTPKNMYFNYNSSIEGGLTALNNGKLTMRTSEIDFLDAKITGFKIPTHIHSQYSLTNHTHGNDYIKDNGGQNIALSIYNDIQLVIRRNGSVVGQINFN